MYETSDAPKPVQLSVHLAYLYCPNWWWSMAAGPCSICVYQYGLRNFWCVKLF